MSGDPERLLGASNAEPLERELLGSVRHVGPPEGAKDLAWRNIAGQIAGGSRSIFGLMVESHLTGGAQKFTPGKDPIAGLEYGKSITDACLGWDDSTQVLDVLSQAVKQRRG